MSNSRVGWLTKSSSARGSMAGDQHSMRVAAATAGTGPTVSGSGPATAGQGAPKAHTLSCSSFQVTRVMSESGSLENWFSGVVVPSCTCKRGKGNEAACKTCVA